MSARYFNDGDCRIEKRTVARSNRIKTKHSLRNITRINIDDIDDDDELIPVVNYKPIKKVENRHNNNMKKQRVIKDFDVLNKMLSV